MSFLLRASSLIATPLEHVMIDSLNEKSSLTNLPWLQRSVLELSRQNKLNKSCKKLALYLAVAASPLKK